MKNILYPVGGLFLCLGIASCGKTLTIKQASTVAPGFIENFSLLSPSQKVYESFELHGGMSSIYWNFPAGGGNFVSGKNYFYVNSSMPLQQSPQAGPQIQKNQKVSLDPALAIPTGLPQRILMNGQIQFEDSNSQRQISFSEDKVHADYFLSDGQTIAESYLLSNYISVPLEGGMGNSPEEFLANYPIPAWINQSNFVANAKWNPGSAYLKRSATRIGDAYFPYDCANSTLPPSTGIDITPCKTKATLDNFFPITFGTTGHPNEIDFAENGTISTIQGLRMWVAHDPVPSPDDPNKGYRFFYEMNGNVYQGVLYKDGDDVRYYKSDETVTNYSIGLNAAAVDSFKNAIITGAVTAGSYASTAGSSGTDLFGIGGHGINGSLNPSDIRLHYDVPANLTGKGQTIAIIDAPGSGNILSDLNTFSAANNLPICDSANPCFQHLDFSTGVLAGKEDWGGEIALDVDMVHGMAPDAKILLVTAASGSNADLMKAINIAAELPGVTAVTMSFSGGATNTAEDQYLQYFQSKGMIFFASSGDGGYLKAPGYPASSIYVTGVGGTRIHSVDKIGIDFAESAWSFGGGGETNTPMPIWQEQLLGFLPNPISPATVDASSSGVLSVPLPSPTASPSATPAPSVSPTSTPTTTPTPVPSPGHMRLVPDVSAVADYQYSAVAIYHGGRWVMSGGTSASSPIWGGIAALLGEHMQLKGKSLPSLVATTPGGFNGLLYQIKGSPKGASSFYDISSGSNRVSAPPCPQCSAGVGYDETTGIGSPDVANLFLNF